MFASRFACAIEIAAADRGGQDRAIAIERGDGVVIALADGAGGTGGGAVAAQAIVDAVGGLDGEPATDALFARFDAELEQIGGQSTAVVLTIDDAGVRGASVGDSGAWLVHGGVIVELTEHQIRKPLVGAGGTPVAFQAGALAGATLVVASDGLLRYGKRDDIARLARGTDLGAAARALIELVRLPTGGLQDDVAVVLCRALR